MKQFTAFMKKELLEQLRAGKILIFTIIFGLFGIMNPAIAKLTPWMMELMNDQLAESGIIAGSIKVTALTSWTQYFKNMPMALIILLITYGSILTSECQRGTLILLITKGMKRWKILTAKTVFLFSLWTAGNLLGYAVTYAYNAFFWDNSTAGSHFLAAFCFYLMGLWLISILPAASAFLQSATAVILSAGGAFAASYLLGLIPKIHNCLPTHLMDSVELLAGTADGSSYTKAIIITLILIVINIFTAIYSFNQKNL